MSNNQNTPSDDNFNFEGVFAKLNEPDEQPVLNTSDVIKDKDKPVHGEKTKQQVIKESSNPIDQIIMMDVRKNFVNRNNPSQSILPVFDRKRASFSNISSTLTLDKNVTKAWLPKLRNILPSYYRPVPIKDTGSKDSPTQSFQQLASAINNQHQLAADQYIRNKADSLVRDNILSLQHQEHTTILSQVLFHTRKNQEFFEGTLRKYLVSSLELKFKHIFVTKDILKHTKLLHTTITSKLDAIKQNTALPEIAKTSLIGDFKKILRNKANTLIADTALSPFKEPMQQLTKNISAALKDAGTAAGAKFKEKYGHHFEEPLYEEGATTGEKVKAAATRARNVGVHVGSDILGLHRHLPKFESATEGIFKKVDGSKNSIHDFIQKRRDAFKERAAQQQEVHPQEELAETPFTNTKNKIKEEVESVLTKLKGKIPEEFTLENLTAAVSKAITPLSNNISEAISRINKEIKTPDIKDLKRKMKSKIDDIKLHAFKGPLRKHDVDDLSDSTDTPNRDKVQISGPGVYIQGVKEELHIPLNDLKRTKKWDFKADPSARFKDPRRRPSVPETFDAKPEQPKESDLLLAKVAEIKDSLKEHFDYTKMIDDAKLKLQEEVTNLLADPKGALQGVGRKAKSILGSLGKGVKGYFKGATQIQLGLLKTLGKFKPKGIIDTVKGMPKALGIDGSFLKKLLELQLGTVGTIAKGSFHLAKKVFSGRKEMYVDVYRKDEVDLKNPLMKGTDIKAGRFVNTNGSVLKDSYSISEPIFDTNTRQMIISADDIKHGLVDNNNNKLTAFSLGNLLDKVVKGTFNLQKHLLRKVGGALVSGLEKIPGTDRISNFFNKKNKSYQVDTKQLKELVNKPLNKIIALLKPISKKVTGTIREGGYEDYKRDHEAEITQRDKKRKNTLTNAISDTAGGIPKIKAKPSSGGVISSLLSLFTGAKDDESSGGEGGGSFLGDVAKYGAGTYAINKVKGWFGKKAVEGVAEQGVKSVAKTGMARAAMSAVGGGLRTAAITTVTSLAGAVSTPVLLGGLAIAGLTAGSYVMIKWLKGRDRRLSISKMRNDVYRVPDSKIKVLIKFEDDIAKASDNTKDESGLNNSKIRDYMSDFGLDPDNKDHCDFFKYWYISVFYPIFKASYDYITQTDKVAWDDQDKLTDEQLNLYHKSLTESSIYQELKNIPIELSLSGFKLWLASGKSTKDAFGDVGKNAEERANIAASLIAAPSHQVKYTLDKEAVKNNASNTLNQLNSVSTLGGNNNQLTSTGNINQDVVNQLGTPKHSSGSGGSLSGGGSYSDFQNKLSSTPNNFVTPLTSTTGTPTSKKGSSAWSVDRKGVAVKMIDIFMKLGWTKEQATGLTSNLLQESSGNPASVGDSGKAYGVAQWHPDRQANFAKWAGKDIRGTTLEEQLGFVDYELHSTEGRAGKMLKAATDAGDAAAVVSQFYERPRDVVGEKVRRAQQANLLLAELGNVETNPDANKDAVAGTNTTTPAGDISGVGATPAAVGTPATAASAPDTGTPSTTGAPTIPSTIAAAPPSTSDTQTTPNTFVTQQPTTTDSLISKYTNKVTTPAADNFARTVNNTSNQTPAVTSTQPVTVIDPEGKNQTNLLSEQNNILGKILATLGGQNTNQDKSTNNSVSDTSGVNNKLVESITDLVATLKSATMGQTSKESVSNKSYDRSIDSNSQGGIDVSRSAYSFG